MIAFDIARAILLESEKRDGGSEHAMIGIIPISLRYIINDAVKCPACSQDCGGDRATE